MGIQSSAMSPKEMLLLGILALIVSHVESLVSVCDSDHRDCSCSDFSYKDCQKPVTQDNFHVNTLEECIFQCDLFHSFGSCDWLRFDQTNSEDENCHLYGPEKETMVNYLGSCNVHGKPTRDVDEKCYIDSSNDPRGFCDIETICPGKCKTCDTDFPCGMIHETECSMTQNGQDSSGSVSTEEGCNLVCTSLGVYDVVTYLTYSLSEERCQCFFSGERRCNNIVMAWGTTFADFDKCGHPNPIPDPTPDPGCDSDSDCPDASKPLCDVPNHVCKAGCHNHGDCAATDYCDCDNDAGSGCPDNGVGSCKLGCRVQGSACTMPDESIGVCTLHVCGPPSGSPRIQKITVETTDCAGCSPGDEGPTIKIEDVTNNFPTSDTCTTPVLGTGSDFVAGNSAMFEKEGLGGCNLYEAFVFNSMTISWSGSGEWTPGVVTVDHELTTCCSNVGGGSASSTSDLKLTCGSYLCK